MKLKKFLVLSSTFFLCYFALDSYVGLVAFADESKDGSFVVLELFTSQGCSSCPAADKLLGEIANQAKEKNLPIYPLSFHVDYWNYLGWKDPYSDAGGTERQREYAKVFERGSVYTPQLVLNGKKEVVGSKENQVRLLINQILKEEAKDNLVIRLEKTEEIAKYKLFYKRKNTNMNVLLNIAFVNIKKQNYVPSGENARNTLSHVNVVRKLETHTLKNRLSGEFLVNVLKESESEDFSLVIFLQDADTKEILAVASKSVNSAL